MNQKFPESDWKVWKRISAEVVERHCSRTLEEVASIAGRDGAPVDRVRGLSQYLGSREKELNDLFNELRRSAALLQIAAAYQRDLITEEELERFSEETRRVARELRKLDR